MAERRRLILFVIAGGGLLAVLLLGVLGLPSFGHYHGIYGLRVAKAEPPRRHATDLVTALNFDLRAFDTLGEEFILFASVTGVVLLLRQLRNEDDTVDRTQSRDDHVFSGASDSLKALSRLLIPLLIALGGYLALHGQLTPGGGFQAGIVLAAGPLAILLGGRYLVLKRLAPESALEVLEAAGAAAYALIGLGGLIFAGIYLKNFLPIGEQGEILSSGMMPLNSIAVGIEVTGAFLLVWTEFLDQSLLTQAEKLSE